MGAVPSWTQIHYRFGNDDGLEALYTFSGAEDTAISLATATTFLNRFAIRQDGTGTANSGVITCQYRQNGGTWTTITTSSSVVKTVASANITNDTPTTNRLTLGGRTFLAGGVVCDDGSAASVLSVVAGVSQFESVFVHQIVDADVANNDTLEFRLMLAGVVLNTYTVTPTITVVKSGSVRAKTLTLMGIG